MIEIARFADVYEAEIVASRLRADGFTPLLGGAEHVRTDPLMLQALGWIRLSVPDQEAVPASARIAALREGVEAIEETLEPDADEPRDRTLPAKVTLITAVLALLAGG